LRPQDALTSQMTHLIQLLASKARKGGAKFGRGKFFGYKKFLDA
jgi:hypothetical protein